MTKNKRKLVMLLVFVMLFSLIPTAGIAKRHASRDIKIVVGDYFVMSDVHPFIENDRTFVPIRFIAEELGYNVRWEQATKKVYITSGNTTIVLTIGSHVAQVNGVNQTLDAAATLRDDRTFVPLRFIAENMGEQVDYNPEGRVAYVNSPNIVINQYFDIKYYAGNNQPIILNVSYNPDTNMVKDKATGREAPVPDDKTAAEFVDDVFENKDNDQWKNRVFEGEAPVREEKIPDLEGYWYIAYAEDYGYEKYSITLEKVEEGVYNAVVESKYPGFHAIARTQGFYEPNGNLLSLQGTDDYEVFEGSFVSKPFKNSDLVYHSDNNTLVYEGITVFVKGEEPSTTTSTSSTSVPQDKQLIDENYVAPDRNDFIVGTWWGLGYNGDVYYDSYFMFTHIGENGYEYSNRSAYGTDSELITKGYATYLPEYDALHIEESHSTSLATGIFDYDFSTIENYYYFTDDTHFYLSGNDKVNFSKY